MPLDVHEDDVLPGALLGRARLDLREVDPEPGQRLEDPIERAGLVAHREQDRRLVARRRTTRLAAHDQEAGRVVRVVLDVGPENRYPVQLPRQVGGDRGHRRVGAGQLGGGGGGERLLGGDVGQVLGQPSPALREPLRVRVAL